jgi:hypothetical protein
MVLRDLTGTAGLQDALTTTNTYLAAVLAQLEETNSARLEQVAVELRELNAKVDRLLAT